MKRLLFCELQGRKEHHHISISRVDPRVRTTLHTHDFPEFFLTLEGNLLHEWNGQRIRMQAGELVFVLASDRHCFECEGSQTAGILNLALSPGWWQMFENLGGPGEITLPSVRRHRRLGARDASVCAQDFRRMLNAVREDTALLTGTVASLVSTLRPMTDTSALAAPGNIGSAPDWLVKLIGELEDSQFPDQRLNYWQRRSGRSPEHLARCCRKYLGCTLTDLVNRARLNRVKTELLRAEGSKIADLALAGGFNNLGHFYRLFRRAEGCSPREWYFAHCGAPAVPR